MNPVLNMVMNMLKAKDPQRYGQLNQMMQSGTNPQEFLKQITSKATPQQMQNVIQMGKQMRNSRRCTFSITKY
jgi:thymidylate synthase